MRPLIRGWRSARLTEFAAPAEHETFTTPNTSRVHWTPGQGWRATRLADPTQQARLALLLGYLETLGGQLFDNPWSTAICTRDGWREGSSSLELTIRGEVPVLCFGLRRGDTTGILLPEPHYLDSRGYLRARLRSVTARMPYERRQPRAVYAGADHGSRTALQGVGPDRHIRARLARVAVEQQLDVDVWLGGGPGPRQQARYRAILDLDGHVRTWDAWFWKLISGSVVLTQQSMWTTFFSEEFLPWEHVVPIAADLSDLSDRLAWVAAHPRECADMAAAARCRAYQVYAWGPVRDRTRAVLEAALLE